MSNTKEILISNLNVNACTDGSFTAVNQVTGGVRHTFGSKNSAGYLITRVNGVSWLLHRIIAKAFLPDYSEDLLVDHINGRKTDNRLENLRMTTNAQNLRGARRPKTSSHSSEYRGVSKVSYKTTGARYVAKFQGMGKNTYLGTFDTGREAAIAWDAVALEKGYEIEALNFPSSVNVSDMAAVSPSQVSEQLKNLMADLKLTSEDVQALRELEASC